jgi:hypothetical protein
MQRRSLVGNAASGRVCGSKNGQSEENYLLGEDKTLLHFVCAKLTIQGNYPGLRRVHVPQISSLGSLAHCINLLSDRLAHLQVSIPVFIRTMIPPAQS